MSVIDSHTDKSHEFYHTASRRPGASALPPPRGECVLTSRDYTLLDAWLIRAVESEIEIDPVLIALVRAKLASARIVLSDDVEPDRARSGSRVVYSLEKDASISQVLAHWHDDAIADSILPVTSIVGVSLLGMRAGQRLPLIRSDGSLGGVSLEAVIPQALPARAEQAAEAASAGAAGEPEARGPSLAPEPDAARTAGDKILPFRPAGRCRKPIGANPPMGPDDPNPGPAAA